MFNKLIAFDWLLKSPNIIAKFGNIMLCEFYKRKEFENVTKLRIEILKYRT